MLQLLKDTNIPFMKMRRVAYVLSAAFMLATLVWLVVHRGPRMSVDFTGGTLLQIATSRPVPVDEVRGALEGAGFEGAEIQTIGERHELLVRYARQGTADAYARMERALEARFPGVDVELRREESVGPKVGSELAEKALWAVLGSLVGILAYVGFRYEFKFALGSVVALFHVLFIIFGVLCFAGREMSLTVVAALLTLAGYAINDTIVVFDRIRERMKALSKETHERAFDIAINETLSRTLITGLSVFFTSVALFFFGGAVINDFALAMMVGVVLSTYSSIYVGSALALEVWNLTDRRRKPVRARAA